ncbi:transketolase [Pelagibacteraceae bacterium]|nr:transketolase [Pelagibacteraceae bacterium]
MRNAFVQEITKIAQKNNKIVLLAGDIGYKLFDDFQKKYPDRFYNCGVAEANMTTTASGLALKGFVPITYTIATFNVYKTLEQIKIDICYPNLGVIIVGVGAGLSYAGLGATHHALEDISVLRSIPNLNIVSPADSFELRSLLKDVIKKKRPTYFRIGKKGEKTIYKSEPLAKVGKGNVIYDGKEICIIATGNIIVNASEAVKNLRKRKIFAGLVSMHTIKPLDVSLLNRLFRKYRYLVILEEHSSIGGLASAISEYYTGKFNGNKFLKLNTGIEFILKSGNQKNAQENANISSSSIEKKIISFLKK